MKAAVYEKYGSPEVLHLKEVEKPAPKADEVLVRVRATTATTYDCWVRSSTAPPGFCLLSRISSGIRGPKQPILGTELAGEIESVGSSVTQIKPGDQVFGFSEKMGTYAEYACVPEKTVALKPANMTYEEAAAVPYGALTALFFLRKANIQRGQKILIYGASGGVGMYAVQLARHFGAEVTGVCSTSKLEMVRSLGADKVIDYTKEDFTRNGQTYDIIFDTIGKVPILRCKKSLTKTGHYILATFGVPKLIQVLWLSLTSSRKVVFGLLEPKAEELNFLKERIEAGEIEAVVDKTFSLEQAAEAHQYAEDGHKRGNVVITVNHDSEM